ncbi:1-phosphofructokinase family hexose kinase [Thalassovita aquimarina]|uniref:Phosphofructokinase n=1 Tax=Thalassovita aquimarina TaxID=2785917 RepID=A0ABS5HNW7_9RHOB|nr:1-phosphofructokinase family hexose kinase [Thalassovita aquimarina]MBR9650642.1 1-phosphofructokinase family hexose kinase [Thalassovita aquimarina]
MQDILTITLNPALDMATATDHVSAGPKLRCDAPRNDPGGGGINVSRVIRTLGGQSRVLVAVGGPLGDTLCGLLRHEGLDLLPISAPGDTRLDLAVTDRSSGGQYRFVMPGPDWTGAHLTDLMGMLADTVPDRGFVVLSGSMPPGVPDDFPDCLGDALAHRRARLIADLSGTALKTICIPAARPVTLLRMNRFEAQDIAGRALTSRAASAGFAAGLVQSGAAEIAVVARAADGSVMATAEGCFHCGAPEVPVRSKIGAGDSFVGGFILALARGLPPEEALRHGTAAATAAVMTEATELCTRADADRLLPLCKVEPLTAETA